MCRYCRGPVQKPRRTFCSGERAQFNRVTGQVKTPGTGCVHEWMVRSDPGYVRKLVFARDKALCAECGTQNQAWAADHIIPVAEGGGACALENYRTLCVPCHRRETAALRKRLADRRKAGAT